MNEATWAGLTQQDLQNAVVFLNRAAQVGFPTEDMYVCHVNLRNKIIAGVAALAAPASPTAPPPPEPPAAA